jgi:sec-independent protein translocase protein TatC
VGILVGWFFAMPLYWHLEGLVKSNLPKGVNYQTMITTLPGAFMLQLKMAAYIGVFVTLPFSVHQIWGFVAPGLRPNERKPIKVIAPISTFLFFLGAWSCWYILPATVYWFGSFMTGMRDTALMLEAGQMVFLLINMILCFGLGFQMPLVVYFLATLEIITPKAMMKYWRHAIVGVVIASAMITPSGDPLSLSVMALPLIALFFASVFAARLTLRKRRSKEDAELDDLD